MKNPYLTLAIGALAWALAACSSPSPTATAIPSGPEFNSFPGASEFVVGENRFPFVLASLEGQLLEGAQVDVTFSFLLGEELSARVTLPAHYREARTDVAHVHTGGEVHPHQEVRGLYVVDDATFDTAGFWLASFLMLTLTSIYLTLDKTRSNIRLAVVVPLASCIVFYLVFLHLFYVPFPKATWWPGLT